MGEMRLRHAQAYVAVLFQCLDAIAQWQYAFQLKSNCGEACYSCTEAGGLLSRLPNYVTGLELLRSCI